MKIQVIVLSLFLLIVCSCIHGMENRNPEREDNTNERTLKIFPSEEISDDNIENKIIKIYKDRSVIDLQIDCNLIGDIGCGLISKHFQNIQLLSLADNQITDDGVEKLSNASFPLENLDLSSNKIKDEGAIYISSATWKNSLRILYLLENQIQDIGAEKLVEAYEHTKRTQDFLLNLDGNPLNERGEEAFRVFLNIGSNHTQSDQSFTQASTSFSSKYSRQFFDQSSISFSSRKSSPSLGHLTKER